VGLIVIVTGIPRLTTVADGVAVSTSRRKVPVLLRAHAGELEYHQRGRRLNVRFTRHYPARLQPGGVLISGMATDSNASLSALGLLRGQRGWAEAHAVAETRLQPRRGQFAHDSAAGPQP
jgi:hypothetical protein